MLERLYKKDFKDRSKYLRHLLIQANEQKAKKQGVGKRAHLTY